MTEFLNLTRNLTVSMEDVSHDRGLSEGTLAIWKLQQELIVKVKYFYSSQYFGWRLVFHHQLWLSQPHIATCGLFKILEAVLASDWSVVTIPGLSLVNQDYDINNKLRWSLIDSCSTREQFSEKILSLSVDQIIWRSYGQLILLPIYGFPWFSLFKIIKIPFTQLAINTAREKL